MKANPMTFAETHGVRALGCAIHGHDETGTSMGKPDPRQDQPGHDKGALL